jgi:hypothetical protein
VTSQAAMHGHCKTGVLARCSLAGRLFRPFPPFVSRTRTILAEKGTCQTEHKDWNVCGPSQPRIVMETLLGRIVLGLRRRRSLWRSLGRLQGTALQDGRERPSHIARVPQRSLQRIAFLFLPKTAFLSGSLRDALLFLSKPRSSAASA